MAIKYKRVLIKISGEALAGEDRFGVNAEMSEKVALQIKEIRDAGVEVAVVCGGGNFFRGRTGENIDRPTADYMGMLATVMNGLALQDAGNAHHIGIGRIGAGADADLIDCDLADFFNGFYVIGHVGHCSHRSKLVQLDYSLFGIRAERRNHKPGRSHTLPPQMLPIKS